MKTKQPSIRATKPKSRLQPPAGPGLMPSPPVDWLDTLTIKQVTRQMLAETVTNASHEQLMIALECLQTVKAVQEQHRAITERQSRSGGADFAAEVEGLLGHLYEACEISWKLLGWSIGDHISETI